MSTRRHFSDDNLDYIEYFDDFLTFTVADWTITTTEAGGGVASEAIADAHGGHLVITNDNFDNDLDFLQLDDEIFALAVGRKCLLQVRFKVLEVIQCDVFIGLADLDTTLLDVSDGLFFKTDDGDALLDFAVEGSDTATAAVGIGTLVADTFHTVEAYYDGANNFDVRFDDVPVPGGVALTNLPSTELTITMGIQNGEATINVLTVDYIRVISERV